MKLITKPRPPITERMDAALLRAQDQELEVEKFVLTAREASELSRATKLVGDVKTGDQYMGVPIEVVVVVVVVE